MAKFNRNYILTVQTENGDILTVKPPFTLEFDITRNTLTSANVCSVRVYNLSQNHRNQIRFNIMDTQLFRGIELKAGYGTNLPIVFSGNINQAWSVREGVNFITAIECYDGGFAFANNQTNETFPSGTAMQTVVESMAGSLTGVTVGVVGNFPGALSRASSYSGSTLDLMRELTGGATFIDNGKVNVLGNSECLQGETLIVNADTGLLGTPVREQTLLTFDMLFEPSLVVGQQLYLQSSTEANFNGAYKVISVKHRGTISESVCGDAVTTVGMFYGTQALSTVQP